jgi:hypothetical protein
LALTQLCGACIKSYVVRARLPTPLKRARSRPRNSALLLKLERGLLRTGLRKGPPFQVQRRHRSRSRHRHGLLAAQTLPWLLPAALFAGWSRSSTPQTGSWPEARVQWLAWMALWTPPRMRRLSPRLAKREIKPPKR